MKKNYRDITVDNQLYGWTVGHMGRVIRIWKDKRIVHETVVHDSISIIPNLIRVVIELRPKNIYYLTFSEEVARSGNDGKGSNVIKYGDYFLI